MKRIVGILLGVLLGILLGIFIARFFLKPASTESAETEGAAGPKITESAAEAKITESAGIEGDWELVSLVIDGVTYEDLARQGMYMTMRLEADGTGVQTINGETYPCTWVERNGEFLIEDSDGSMSYTLQPDGSLLGVDGVGDTMSFVPVAETDSAAGVWQLTAAETEGIIVNDISELDVELCLRLDPDGTGELYSSEGDASCTWTQRGTSVTVVTETDEASHFSLRSDGTLTWLIDDVTLIMSRTDGSAKAEAPEIPDGATVSEYGFSVQLPQGWFAVDSEFVQQIVESVGEEMAAASGFDQNLLDQLAAAGTSLYYSSDMSANFNVVRESAGGITMDDFASLEPVYQELLSSSRGITDFKLSGPVDIGGNPYYVGSFTAPGDLEQKQYFCVAKGYIYTITLTNVAEGDAQQIMESFQIL